MITFRDAFFTPPIPVGTASFRTLPGANKPSLSKKPWAQPYHRVRRFRFIVNTTPEIIDTELGPEDAFERHVLGRRTYPFTSSFQWLQTEGDAVRAFHTCVSNPIQSALYGSNGPFIVQRSESGPLGPTHVNQTVDFTWAFQERCLVIGELKKPGIIDPSKWKTGPEESDTNRRQLGQELRG